MNSNYKFYITCVFAFISPQAISGQAARPSLKQLSYKSLIGFRPKTCKMYTHCQNQNHRVNYFSFLYRE